MASLRTIADRANYDAMQKKRAEARDEELHKLVRMVDDIDAQLRTAASKGLYELTVDLKTDNADFQREVLDYVLQRHLGLRYINATFKKAEARDGFAVSTLGYVFNW